MGYIPSVAFADCPACGKAPLLKHKFFSLKVRLECECGVAGQWVCDETVGNSWNIAGRGWELVAGKLAMPLPPHPKR